MLTYKAGQLNAARASIRFKMIKGLFNPIDTFLKQKCNCRDASLFAYTKALSRTDIWPLNEQHKQSLCEILRGEGFRSFDCVVPQVTCVSCRSLVDGHRISSFGDMLMSEIVGLC